MKFLFKEYFLIYDICDSDTRYRETYQIYLKIAFPTEILHRYYFKYNA